MSWCGFADSRHITVQGAYHEGLLAQREHAAVVTESILQVVTAVRVGTPLPSAGSATSTHKLRPPGYSCARRITMRRCGSSPIDCVATPATPRSARCTQRRSRAGIGSSWSMVPDSMTFSAARWAISVS